MATTLSCNLSVKGLKSLAKSIEVYKKDFEKRVDEYLETLCKYAKEVAEANGGEWSNDIVFVTSKDDKGYYLIGSSISPIMRTWYHRGGGKWEEIHEEISSMLMAEFGSGTLAVNVFNLSGVGQGTFPVGGQGNNADGWYYINDEVEGSIAVINAYHQIKYLHHSNGETPSMPMFKAIQMVQSKSNSLARAIIGTR